jgi:hypothetical protein
VWAYHGVIRVHFNRKEESPRLASITNHTHSWEMICRSVDISGDVQLTSAADLSAPPTSPIWWLEGVATVTVDDYGNASIRP